MRDELDKIAQRTQAYWFVDGLAEMMVGCIVGLIALLFLIDGTAPEGSPLHLASSLGLAPVILIGGWAGGRIVTAIKARITYPRTGFVSYPRKRGRRLATVAFAAFVAALAVAAVMVLAAVSKSMPSLLVLAQGAIGAAALAYLGSSMDLRRFYVLAVLSIAFGIAGAATGLGDILGDALYFGLMALALIASGALTLRVYLRDAPPPAAAGEDDAA